MEKPELTQPILQYPTDLVFAVTDHDVASLLTVLKTHTVMIDRYTVQFAIVGESHCITVYCDNDFVMQEVLACTEIPEILQADSHKFAKLESYRNSKHNYQACVWFAKSLDDVPGQHDGILELDFPEMFDQTPFTQIHWRVSHDNIQWKTIHVYPLETHTTYVHTQSYFDLIERSNNE